MLAENYQTYVIDDAELERVEKSYPIIWKDKNAKPKLAFIGCPHLSINQLYDWAHKIEESLKKKGNKKVVIPTVMTAAPGVVNEFKKSREYSVLVDSAVIISSICPLMYMNNPQCGKMPVITCSNKLRTYTSSKFMREDVLLDTITGGAL